MDSQTKSHYRIVEKLGEGGMGEVYLAEDTRLGRRVALKILPQMFAEDEDRLRRFEQEARAASNLNHPNIVTIYDIGQDGATPFIAAEFIDGVTLRDHISEREIKALEALDISVQIASALDAAHRAGVVHRDIKPENIMIRVDSLVKVLDFGLAKLVESGQGAVDNALAATQPMGVTDPGAVIGTYNYMSPEQARGIPADARADIWSMGCVIYEMIAGRPDEARKLLRELDEISKQRYVLPYFRATVYTGLGDKDEAFQWLERAFEERHPGLVLVNIDPRFDSLRSDPRFADLLLRLNVRPRN